MRSTRLGETLSIISLAEHEEEDEDGHSVRKVREFLRHFVG